MTFKQTFWNRIQKLFIKNLRVYNDHVNKYDPTGRIGIGLTLLIAIGVGIAFDFGIKTIKQAYNGGYLNSDLSTWN